MKRSVGRIDGVREVSLDLNSGRTSVVFHAGKAVKPPELWEAIKAAGFTPVRVEIKDEVYEGPKP